MDASAPPCLPETFEPKTRFHRAWESPVRVDPAYKSVRSSPDEVKEPEDVQISGTAGVDYIPSPDYTRLGIVTSTPQDRIKPRTYVSSVLKEDPEALPELNFDDCQSPQNNETSAAVASIVKENSDMYSSTFAPSQEVDLVPENMSMSTQDFHPLIPSFLCEKIKPQNLSSVSESGFHSESCPKTELAIRPDKTDRDLNEPPCLMSANTEPSLCHSLSIKPMSFVSPKAALPVYQYEDYEKDLTNTKENLPLLVPSWAGEVPQMQHMIPPVWKSYQDIQSTFVAERDTVNAAHEVPLQANPAETGHHWPWMMSTKPWSDGLPFYNTIPNTSLLQPIIPVTTYASVVQPLLQHQLPNPVDSATTSWFTGKYLNPVENTAIPQQSDSYNASLQGAFTPFEKYADPRVLTTPLPTYESSQSIKTDFPLKSAFTSVQPVDKQTTTDTWSNSLLENESYVQPHGQQLHRIMKTTTTFSRGRRKKKPKLSDDSMNLPHSLTSFSTSRLSANSGPDTTHHQPTTEFLTDRMATSVDQSFTNNPQQLSNIDTFLDREIESRGSEIQRLLDDPCKQASRQNKLNPTAINVMEQWYREHIEHPYPTIEEKEQLALLGSITLAQVNSWFANRRTRSSNTRPKKVKRHLHERLRVFTKDIERIARGTINGDVLCDQIYTIIEDHLG